MISPATQAIASLKRDTSRIIRSDIRCRIDRGHWNGFCRFCDWVKGECCAHESCCTQKRLCLWEPIDARMNNAASSIRHNCNEVKMTLVFAEKGIFMGWCRAVMCGSDEARCQIVLSGTYLSLYLLFLKRTVEYLLHAA